MPRFLFLFILLAIPVVGVQAQQQDEANSWTIEFLENQATLHRVQDLISFGDQLYVFNTKKKHPKSVKHGPGVLKNGQLEMLPSFRSATKHIQHTLWNNQLIVAGHLPLTSLPDEQKVMFSNRLASFDGEKWQQIGQGFKGRVSALISWRGNLIVAGSLEIEGHPELHSLAQWNGQQWLEVSGQPSGGGEARIKCLAVHKGNLVVGGIFSEMGETVVRNLASFDGQTWSGLGGAANGVIAGIVSYEDNLFANGWFTCIGGQAIEELARWDGRQWHSMTVQAESPLEDRPHELLKMLPTPEGLYMSGKMGVFTGQKGKNLARWTSQGWDISIPSINFLDIYFELTKRSDPQMSSSGPKKLSQPRKWPEEPFFHEITQTRLHTIKALAWYQNELVLLTARNSENAHSGYNSRILALRNNTTHNLLKNEEKKSRIVGAYRGGELFLEKNKQNNSRLVWRKSDSEKDLGSWPSKRSSLADHHFLVKGDSIFAAGNFESFAGLLSHNVAVYDGSQWQTMGDGIPFDFVSSPKLHIINDRLYLTGRFTNQGFRPNPGLLQWNGQQWKVAELDSAGYDRAAIQSDGTWLFRANTERPTTNQFKSPAHQMQSFPAESIPYIERRRDDRWERVWQGQSGQVTEIVHDGQTLWCTVAGGRDINLLKLVDDQWITMCDQPIAGTNSLSRLIVLKDKPVITIYQKRENHNNLHRLASLHQGQWYFFGPAFSYSNKFWIEDNQLCLESDFHLNLEEPLRHGVFRWNGNLYLNAPVPDSDFTQLDEWEIICRASNQASRPEIDLAQPRGLEKSSVIIRGEKAGWHLSRWPRSNSQEDFFETRGKNTLILKPNSFADLYFFFPWNTQQPGLLTFEFRLIGPENWPANESSYGYDQQHKDVPSLSISINNRNVSRVLWAEDEQWHKVSISFGKELGNDLQKLIFRNGKNETGNGHIEIKNLRIEKKKHENHKKLTKEITKRWKKYPCPDEAEQRIKILCKKFNHYYNDLAGSRNTSLYSFSGLAKGLLFPEDYRTWDGFGSKKNELKLVVDNLSGGDISSGWTAGGGLYVIANIIDRDYEPGRFFHKLHADTSQIRTVKGLILDMRKSDPFSGAPSQLMFSQANHYLSLFADKAHCWGKVQTGTQNSPLTDLIIQPADEPWTKVPVVVLVGEMTPGCVVMILNSLPNVSTVGRPSMPVGVPTKPHLLPNGVWGDFPAGWVYDAEGNDVSLCRIAPDVVMPLNASWDAAVREAMLLLGLKPDPESNFCPAEIFLPGG